MAFPWEANLKVSAGSSKVSKKASLSKILDEFDKEGYYTVKGQLYKGPGSEKRNDRGRIKDDNVLFEKKDVNMKITLWKRQIDEVDSGSFYKLSHVKISDNNGVHLTTSPSTAITPLTPGKINVIPKNYAIPDDFEDLVVTKISKISVPKLFSSCGVCKKKVLDSNIRKRAFTCTNCNERLTCY